MKSRAVKMILLGIKQFRDPYYQGFAAQMSFYILLSLVPTVIVPVSYTHLDVYKRQE